MGATRKRPVAPSAGAATVTVSTSELLRRINAKMRRQGYVCGCCRSPIAVVRKTADGDVSQIGAFHQTIGNVVVVRHLDLDRIAAAHKLLAPNEAWSGEGRPAPVTRSRKRGGK